MAPARDFMVVVITNCRSADSSTVLALDDVAALFVTRYSGGTASGPRLETPVFLSLRRVNRNFAFDYLTLPGVPYIVETSPDLSNWTSANGAGGQTATSLQTSYIDTNPGPRKFCRAKAAP